MFRVWRIEHRNLPCMGPSGLFSLGVYAPRWQLRLPPKDRKRPHWTSDEVLCSYIELEPTWHESWNGHVHHDWYFAFDSLYQLEEWFPLRWRKRNAYLKHGAVIREYRGPRVLFGETQCVIHSLTAERVGTFHIYRPTEAVCPSTSETAAPARIAV